MNVYVLGTSRCVLFAATLAAVVSSVACAGPTWTFEADVRPILKTHCFQWHGEESMIVGNLDVRHVRLLVLGGDCGWLSRRKRPWSVC